MKNEITLQTRRKFLRRTVLGSALTWTVPAFLADTFSALQAQAAASATQTVTGKDATILVVPLEDFLNTCRQTQIIIVV